MFAMRAAKRIRHCRNLPSGVIGAVRWNKNNRDLGFMVINARGPGDVYSVDVTTGRVGTLDRTARRR